MSWEDVKAKFKFYGPVADEFGNETGLDGDPTFVNGWKAADYGGSFGLSEKNTILSVLQVPL
jgi:hypothetical protein